MENGTKKSNIVNNARWLFLDVAKKASASMRLFKGDRNCMALKLQLMARYERTLVDWETVAAPLEFVVEITLPDFNPSTDDVALRVGSKTKACTAGTCSTAHQVLVWLCESHDRDLIYDAEFGIDGEILYICNYDATLPLVDVSLTVAGTPSPDNVVDSTSSAEDMVEGWNQLEYAEVYAIPPEMVRIRERRCKCQNLQA